MCSSIYKSLHLTIFYIAMAMLESAVVIYLREIYYPNGFNFPLVGMKDIIIFTELVREFATIIMLWTIAYIAGRNFSSRFAWFIIGFGIWDIFYYVFLFVFIQWPATLLDWDILFLIPIPWYGPVIAPVLISIGMISLGSMILHFDNTRAKTIWRPNALALLLIGSILSLYTFMYDFCKSIGFVDGISIKDQILSQSQVYIPINYSYGLFVLAIGFILTGVIIFYKGNSRLS